MIENSESGGVPGDLFDDSRIVDWGSGVGRPIVILNLGLFSGQTVDATGGLVDSEPRELGPRAIRQKE
jgi:hypothetical protein